MRLLTRSLQTLLNPSKTFLGRQTATNHILGVMWARSTPHLFTEGSVLVNVGQREAAVTPAGSKAVDATCNNLTSTHRTHRPQHTQHTWRNLLLTLC
jgi:hypothetical protein